MRTPKPPAGFIPVDSDEAKPQKQIVRNGMDTIVAALNEKEAGNG